MDAIFYAFAVLLFAAIILMVEGAYLWWSGTHGGAAQRIARRLNLMSGSGAGSAGERVSILKQRSFASGERMDALLHRLRLAHAVDKLLLQAGLKWTVVQFLGVSCALFLAGLLFAQLWSTPLPVRCAIVLAFGAIPCLLVRRARAARLKRVEEQLPEAADFVARALRAGHAFTNVLQMVGAELPEPLSGEFRTAHQEINYGVPLNEALHNLADRVPLTDLRYLVIAVLIQRESGGNLAEILGNISHIIRERLKLLGQVRVLSAEGRMSAWILGLLPFVVTAVMSVANLAYISMLWTDPAGIKLLWYGGGMIAAGVIWLRRVIHIHV